MLGEQWSTEWISRQARDDKLLFCRDDKVKIMQFQNEIQNLFSDTISDIEIENFLLTLKDRPIIADELLALVQLMLSKAQKIFPQVKILMDTCGTGGDNSGSFNFSTATALLLASLGIPIAKHGNRAISSQSGSADLLETLGISIQLSPEQATQGIETNGFAFLFAPNFHQATARVQQIRKKIKIRTLFNLLGPLTNPAPLTHQLVGVYDTNVMEPVAEVLVQLGRKGFWVVHGAGNMDELSMLGTSQVIAWDGKKLEKFKLHPSVLGFSELPLQSIQGGTARENAKLLLNIFQGHALECPIVQGIIYNTVAGLKIINPEQDYLTIKENVLKHLQSGNAYQYYLQLKA